MDALEYPPELREQVAHLVVMLHASYVKKLTTAPTIIINIMKKKGVRLTENFETPLDAGPPV